MEKRMLFSTKHNLKPKRYDGDGDTYKNSQIKFFNTDATKYERDITLSPYFNALEDNYFLKWLDDSIHQGETLIDIGCGTGRQLLPIARRGIKALGLDISEGMLLLAGKKLREEGLKSSVNLVLGDCEAMPLKSGLFDGCVLNGTLHHLKDQPAAVKEAARVIKSRGLFFSCDPHSSPVRFLFDLSMGIWKLHDEETGEDCLLNGKKLHTMLEQASVRARVDYSTYLLPHLFLFLKPAMNRALLKATDMVFGGLPLVRKLGGQIVVRGVKN
jgi:ubiquinone/menaquinone biosynthesis C-methylase UbiE